MAKELLTAAIDAVGFLGLNTQESGVNANIQFARQADNCVIDKFGRLGARKGWVTRTTSIDTVSGNNVGIDLEGLCNFIDITGSNTYISWSEDTFYKGVLDLTTITPTTTDSITDGGWQAVSLNDREYFFQGGYKPLYYTNETTPNEFKSIDQHSGYTGTAPDANCVMSAYGRLWAAGTSTNKTTVYFTDVLNGVKWAGGTSGSLDVSAVLTNGTDEIVALGAHNGYVIIFCKRAVIIYGDNDNFQSGISTTSLTLVEVIEGVGCIARDSVQNTGSDIIFLSDTGVQSLNRTVQEKSQPIRDISRNIKDDIIQAIQSETVSNIKSVWSPHNSFYLLSFPTSKFIYCFNSQVVLEDGSYRVTQWTGLTHKALLDYSDKLYIAQIDGVAEFFGYSDNGSQYRMVYFTNPFDLGLPNVIKVAKRIASTVVGATGQDFVMKVGFDYNTQYRSFPYKLSSGIVYEYGIGEYNVAEYSGGLLIEQIRAPAAGSGAVMQVGFEADINGAPISLQKISTYVKQGKVL